MARAAMEEQTKTGSQIKVLEEQVKIMGTKLRTVQSLASQTSRDANDAYNTAINIYQQAKSIEVPSIDEENIEKQANRVQEEANQIKQEVKFIYSEKATKFCEIFTLLLSYVVPVKSKVKILQNFVAFSEYMNFKSSSRRTSRKAEGRSENPLWRTHGIAS